MSLYFKKKYYFEEYAYILSYNVPHRTVKEKKHFGFERVKEIYSQAIGKDYFTLLELVSDPVIPLEKGELIYIGKFGITKIKRVSARLLYEELTEDAKFELESILKRIVKEQEKRFVEFFNTSGPLSPRIHSFELFPRIGKKTVEKILIERNIKKFENYEDIKKRIGVSSIEEIIYERLVTEITSKEKLNYYLFAKGIESTIEERKKTTVV